MASFPNSVFTRADITNGQTSQPADVNDLSAEITAIEDALLNQTYAPSFNSSIVIGSQHYIFPSSGPAVGENLQCVSTNGSTATLQWRPAPGGQAMTEVACVSPTAVASGSATAINWTTVLQSRGTAMLGSTSVNSSRLGFVNSTGNYLVTAAVQWNACGGSTGHTLTLDIFYNDGNVQAGQTIVAAKSTTYQQSIQTVIRAASTSDYVTIRVTQTTGSTGSLSSNGSIPCRAAVVFLGL